MSALRATCSISLISTVTGGTGFAFAVNGTRNEKEYGFIHDYKDLIEDFEEL